MQILSFPQIEFFNSFNRQLDFFSITNNSYTTVQIWQATILAIRGVMETLSVIIKAK